MTSRFIITAVVSSTLFGCGVGMEDELGSASAAVSTGWTQRGSGPARFGNGFAFMPSVCKAVSFGDGTSYATDTLLFDSATGGWTTLNFSPRARPEGRWFPGLSWNPAQNVAVLFGGNAPTRFLQDTWAFNPSTRSWTGLIKSCRNVACPPARRLHGQAWSAAVGATLVFGGEGPSEAKLNDTWLLTGKTWRRLSTPVAPPARSAFGMAEDRATGMIVVYGGMGAGQGTTNKLSDTWILNPVTGGWSQAPEGPVPAARYGVAMTYLPSLGKIVLHSGYDTNDQATNETWAFDMATRTWSQLGYPSSPAPRALAKLTADTCRGTALMYGGRTSADANGTTGEVWELY